jgi:amidase
MARCHRTTLGVQMGSPTATERRELAFAGVARQAALVRNGAVTPRELVETALDRIAELDPQLNAFRTVFAEQALLEADQAAGRIDAGDGRPLLGVPIAVKDDTPVAGTPRTCGSNAHGGPEPEDAEFVRRLRAAGAIVVGITRTPELAAWPFTETAAGGITRNPWNPQRTPGGSSGGSGAAVGAALVPGATASDGAGSIRIPAACCGLFGLKVSRGGVPTAPYEAPFGGLSVYGFLTRSVDDAALLYEVVTGKPYVAAAQQDPPRLRIALALRIPPGSTARLTGDWRRAAEETAELLRSLGHEIVEREPSIGPVGLNVVARYLAGIEEEAGAVEHPERLERRTRGLARLGKAARRPAARARRNEAKDAARVNAIFDDVDVVLGPTLAKAPLPIGRYEGRSAAYTLNGVLRWVPFNGVWNHLGNPAAAVPAGFDADGLPLSVQLVGRPDSEQTLFSLSHELETARPWADARPPVS